MSGESWSTVVGVRSSVAVLSEGVTKYTHEDVDGDVVILVANGKDKGKLLLVSATNGVVLTVDQLREMVAFAEFAERERET